MNSLITSNTWPPSAAPSLIVGDIRLHLDDSSQSTTARFGDILGGADLTQHVTGATHWAGHTSDVLIKQSDVVVSMTVDQSGAISDQSLIIANIVPGLAILPAGATVTRLVTCDEAEFRKDLAESDLITSPPANCDEYFACKDDTLRRLLRVHAPIRAEVHRSRPSAASRFNSVCRQEKVKTRRLEKIYRATRLMDLGAAMSTRSTVYFRRWCIQTDVQRRVFQTAYSNFWSNSINNSFDSKSLWRKMKSLLNPSSRLPGLTPQMIFSRYFTAKLMQIARTPADHLHRQSIGDWFRLSVALTTWLSKRFQILFWKRHQCSVI